MAKKWRRIVEQDCFDLAEQRELEYLGGFAGRAHGKVRWRCQDGHEWENSYSAIKYGKGCPHCAGNMRLQDSDYHQIADKRGIAWNGPLPPNVHTKTGWECPEGHTWKAAYTSLKVSILSGCPHCAGNARKVEKDYHDLAEQRGFKFLGPFPGNVMTNTWWQCNRGHKWESRYDNIREGNGCPYCAPNAPKTVGDYHQLAKERGFEFLGPFPNRAHDNTTWRCPKGHTWEAAYSIISSAGSGCPTCAIERTSGPNHYLWNGEKTDEERNDDRKYREYSVWRQAVYERDDYACQICGDNTGGALVAHHLNSYLEHEDLRTDVDNGVTLCEPCHVEYHMTYGWEGACVADFIEFAESYSVHFSNRLINI